MIRKTIAFITAFVIGMMMLAVGSSSATATTPNDCENPTIVEVTYVEHPAETHEVNHPTVTHEETVIDSPAIWEVWSPNHTQGPQDYTPDWPVDNPTGEPRGTWQAAAEQIPPGHAGPDGVYQQGSGNSPFFYRQAERSHVVTVVDEEAWTETVVDKEAYTEEVVTEVPNPDYPCEPPVECPPGTSPRGDGCHPDFNRDTQQRSNSVLDCRADEVTTVEEVRLGFSRGDAPLIWSAWEIVNEDTRPATNAECPEVVEPPVVEPPVDEPNQPATPVTEQDKPRAEKAVPFAVDAGLAQSDEVEPNNIPTMILGLFFVVLVGTLIYRALR